MGYDAGKKIKGCKIHALVDTLGLPMRIIVHSAGIQDRDGAGLVLDKIRNRFPWLDMVWADGGYKARQVDQAVAKVPIEIVKRSDDMTGFVVLPRRWVVERTFSWFGRNRRLAKDYENLADTGASIRKLRRWSSSSTGGQWRMVSPNSMGSCLPTRRPSTKARARSIRPSSFRSLPTAVPDAAAGPALHTAVTRGKPLVVIVGQKKAMAVAVRGKHTRQRYSKLREWLAEASR